MEITFKKTPRGGRRAYRLDRMQGGRLFPIKMDRATKLIADGKAVEVEWLSQAEMERHIIADQFLRSL